MRTNLFIPFFAIFLGLLSSCNDEDSISTEPTGQTNKYRLIFTHEDHQEVIESMTLFTISSENSYENWFNEDTGKGYSAVIPDSDLQSDVNNFTSDIPYGGITGNLLLEIDNQGLLELINYKANIKIYKNETLVFNKDLSNDTFNNENVVGINIDIE